ncbi:unnamed protein product [Leptidea sinapis]|uniref:Cystatin domain-containing protein n=1 Tax=Leptidea sinapis TaxID=189913 RepID=A0A5E4R3U3_9NEOP|nr:unnamed protein product [Leptidea sinapis]
MKPALRNGSEDSEENSDVIQIEAILKGRDNENIVNTKCIARVVDLEHGIIVEDKPHCQEEFVQASTDNTTDVTQEDAENTQKKPGEATVEELVTAIPTTILNTTCYGCDDLVDASGGELADLAIKQLNKNNPNVKHVLDAILDAKKQIQLFSRVKYMLTLKVNFDNCSSYETETCAESRPCKVSILEKSWIKLADGSKNRVVVSNNCTDQKFFGDDVADIQNRDSDHKFKVKLKLKMTDENSKSSNKTKNPTEAIAALGEIIKTAYDVDTTTDHQGIVMEKELQSIGDENVNGSRPDNLDNILNLIEFNNNIIREDRDK